MHDLTATQISIFTVVVGIVGAFLGWLGRGFTFVLTRWWSESPKRENAAYLNAVAELGAKLRANGMTMGDVRQLEATMLASAVASSPAASAVVQQLAEETVPSAFGSNLAMKARTGSAYEVAEAKLQQVLMDLRLLVGEEDWPVIEEVQAKWRDYRRALEDWALRQYLGGTHSTLAMALAGLAETERRTLEVQAEVVERSAR